MSTNLTNSSKDDFGNYAIDKNYVDDKLKEENYVIIYLYIPVFLSALIANSVVIIVVIKDHYMRSVTNYFLVNLSIADLLVTLISMPEAAIKAYELNYHLGRYFCKTSSYLQSIAVSSSIFTITVMTLDRYLVITKPLRFHRYFNQRNAVLMIVFLWTLSMTLLLPMYLIVDLSTYPIPLPYHEENETIIEICTEDWTNFTVISRQTMGIIWFISIFAVPGAIMTFGYSIMGKTLCSATPPLVDDGDTTTEQRNRLIRNRKRIACILLLLAFLFNICWLPYHIMLLLLDTDKIQNDIVKELNTYFLLLGHVNSALNPIIYCALSRRFRASIKNLFACKIPVVGRKPPSLQWADSSGYGTPLTHTQELSHHLGSSRIKVNHKSYKTCAV